MNGPRLTKNNRQDNLLYLLGRSGRLATQCEEINGSRLAGRCRPPGQSPSYTQADHHAETDHKYELLHFSDSHTPL